MKNKTLHKQFSFVGKIFVKKVYSDYSSEELLLVDKFLEKAINKYIKDLKMFMVKNRLKFEYDLEIKRCQTSTESKAEASTEKPFTLPLPFTNSKD